jgi:hypothetical protein
MDKGTPSHIELAYSSIPVFADDGTIDMGELNFLMGIALRDDRIDEDEKRILKSIFDKVSAKDVTPRVWERIEAIRSKYGI